MKQGAELKGIKGEEGKRGGKCASGFSLMETLVAVAVLTTGLTAALGLLSFVIRTVEISRNASIASHLAVEGIEVVRNLRDVNWLRRDVGKEERQWFDELVNGSYEVTYETVFPLSSDQGRFLLLDTQGRYRYDCSPCAQTPFRRRMDIERLPDNIRLRVKATVSWQDKFTTREVMAEEILYDWK